MQNPIKADTRAAEFQYNNVTAPCRKRTLPLPSSPSVSLRARTSRQLIPKRDLSAAGPVAAIDESSRHDDSFKSRTSSRVGELARCTRGHCVRSRIDPHFSSARGLRNKSAYTRVPTRCRYRSRNRASPTLGFERTLRKQFSRMNRETGNVPHYQSDNDDCDRNGCGVIAVRTRKGKKKLMTREFSCEWSLKAELILRAYRGTPHESITRWIVTRATTEHIECSDRETSLRSLLVHRRIDWN